MIISGLEVNLGNVAEWSAKRLWHFRYELRLNMARGVGDMCEQKLLDDVMTVEIKRKKKIEKIDIAAVVKIKQLISKSNEERKQQVG